MDIFKVVLICVGATLLIALLREHIPEISIYMGIAVGIIIFLMVAEKVNSAITVFRFFAEKAEVSSIYLSTIIKIIGIAYLTEFGAEICKDAGESSIASKIELYAKVVIFMISMPILAALMETIISLIP